MRWKPLIAYAVVFAACASAGGQALHDADIVPSLDPPLGPGGELTPGAVIVLGRAVAGEGGAQEIAVDRVFDADLVPFFGFAFTEDPGYNTPANTFLPNRIMRVDMLDALRVWDDVGKNFDGFVVDDPSHRLELAFGAFAALSPPPPASPGTPVAPVSGPRFSVTSLGEFHKHLDMLLPDTLEEGVYLMRFRLVMSDFFDESRPPIAESAHYFIVFNWARTPQGRLAQETQQAEAMQHARENLLTPPCPFDLNGSGSIDPVDLAMMLAGWRSPWGPVDLAGLLASWRADCP